MTEQAERFTWIPFYQELAHKLLDYEARQAELLAIAQELSNLGHVNPFEDRSAPGTSCPLTEMDPFTFLGIFNRRKIKDEKRIAILQYLKDRFNIQTSLPADFDSIPVIDSRKAWFFPYQYERRPDDIATLWRLFKLALEEDPLANPDFDSVFNQALAIKNVYLTLTMGLYWIHPSVFVSADNVNQKYLQAPIKKLNAESYRKFIEKSLEANASFPELSYQAHIHREGKGKASQKQPAIQGKNSSANDLTDLAQLLGVNTSTIQGWLKQLSRKGQIILQGPPGTGKTFVAEHLAKWLTRNGGETKLVQFHPSYSYEDFIQGYRPDSVKGQLVFTLKNGVFKRFCDDAAKTDKPYVLIIDEINRANLSSVFGELMYLLEYRNKNVQLQSGEAFSIPENVLIIGTMNTADRSIALMDHALRRRFAFIELLPQYELIQHTHKQTLTDILAEINAAIDDPHYWLGHSYFLGNGSLQAVWEGEIYPYLSEYFIDQRERVEPYTWQRVNARLDLAHANN